MHLVTIETKDNVVSKELQKKIQLQDEFVDILHQKQQKLKVYKFNFPNFQINKQYYCYIF